MSIVAFPPFSNSSPTQQQIPSAQTHEVGCVCFTKGCVHRPRKGPPWTPAVLDEQKSPSGLLVLILSPLLVPPNLPPSILVFSPRFAPFICMWAHTRLLQACCPHELKVLCKQRTGHWRIDGLTTTRRLNLNSVNKILQLLGSTLPRKQQERQYASQHITTANRPYPSPPCLLGSAFYRVQGLCRGLQPVTPRVGGSNPQCLSVFKPSAFKIRRSHVCVCVCV